MQDSGNYAVTGRNYGVAYPAPHMIHLIFPA